MYKNLSNDQTHNHSADYSRIARLSPGESGYARLSTDRFEYTCTVRYTEIDPRMHVVDWV